MGQAAVEAPVLNARLRKAWLNGAMIAAVGEAAEPSYPVVSSAPVAGRSAS